MQILAICFRYQKDSYAEEESEELFDIICYRMLKKSILHFSN